MRGCILGGAVLTAVILLVILNAVFVGNTVEDLTAALEDLPETPDPAVTPTEITALRELLESKETLLGLSISYAVMDKVTEALYTLEAAARGGDVFQYRETVALLRDLVEDVGRLEKLSVKNLV